jgi:hypothetical protein
MTNADDWPVLPHRPLEKLEPNLWRVEGDLPNGRGTRVMTLARLANGDLVIHNAVALEEPLMKELEAFGRPSLLIVPNSFHRIDAARFKKRYPSLRVVCPAGARAKVAKVVPVDATYADALADDGVKLAHLDGTADREGFMEVRSDGKTTLVFNDVIMNVPKLGFPLGFLLGPTGKPALPRVIRWFLVKDKKAFGAHLQRLATTPNLERVIVSHGAVLGKSSPEVLRTVAAEI